MQTNEFEMFQDRQRSNWVRLRTLVLLRWGAISGQIAAVYVASEIYHLNIETGPAYLTIAASIVANLIFSFVYPENKRLSEREASGILGFDIVQLCILLYLTGGLSNPFAVLVLAPVTIAATVMHLSSTIALGALALVLISALSQFAVPMQTADGAILALPDLLRFGFWIALVIGVVFLAIYARQVTTETQRMGDALLATQLALAREQKLTDLGGVVAAAAHELGTPLATIKLVSGEMLDELDDQPALVEDLHLIRQQADRCREILQSMGRAGKDDLHLRSAPLETVVREAAEPHLQRGKDVLIAVNPIGNADPTQPLVMRRPEIIHGLRNLIQNAVDFADSHVEIDAMWSRTEIVVRIADDGQGFPLSVIGRIGDPFMRRRRGNLDRAFRPGYEGMGLGLFIAKTLLERSGAQLVFENETGLMGGAIVTVTWPQEKIARATQSESMPLGENQRITE